MHMRFHVLGTGAIGCQVASVLRPRHPVTLLLRNRSALQDFKELNKCTINYNRLDKSPSFISDFDAESLADMPAAQSPIEALVVATKAQHAVDAVRSVQPYLTSSSTLILLQNGMGLAEELLETLWPKLPDAPSFIVGVNRHSVERIKPFHINHYSGWNDPEGGLMLGAMPHSDMNRVNGVIKAFKDIPEFNTAVYNWDELRRRMMRKLVVNASINPVAAILDCRNGELLENPYAMKLIRNVCEEASKILTELDTTTNELNEIVINMLKMAAGNNCSTLQDMRAKRKTEIDYINGYLLRLARSRGIPAPTNEFLLDTVHAKEVFAGAK